MGQPATAIYNATLPTYADGDRALPSMDANGRLVVNTSGTTGGQGSVAFSATALEKSHVIKAAAGNLFGIVARLDSTAPAGTYYFLVINAAALPANGAVTQLCGAVKVQHVLGVDDFVDIEFIPQISGVAASLGIVLALSTTEFTLTLVGTAYMSLTGGSYT